MSFHPIIMKFGGTSVEDVRAFERVRGIVRAAREARPVVVVSAMTRVTDALLQSVQTAESGDGVEAAIASLDKHFERHAEVARALLSSERVLFIETMLVSARSEIKMLLVDVAERRLPLPLLQDSIVAYGERLSATLLAAVLEEDGLPATYVDARRCIITDEEHGRAAPLLKETQERMSAELSPLIEQARIPVLGGFIASSLSGATTTLGRGGSDYTAALVGALLRAREIQIWTDVTGVLTADPRVVRNTRTIKRLSYAEASELAYFGAKVLHPKTIQPAIEGQIPVRICNSRTPEEAGTLVCAETETSPRTVKAIAHKTGVTTLQITSARMLGAYGFLRVLFEVFDRHRTAVDVVTTSEVSVSLSLDDASALPAIVAELEKYGTVNIERGRAIVCVVGEGLRGTPGIAASVFTTIKGINVSLISQGASSINLTFVVDEACVTEAVNRLHEAFFEESEFEESKVQSLKSKVSGALAS